MLVRELPIDLTWRKAAASGAQNDCLELAWLDGGARVALRDSKSRTDPAARALSLDAAGLAALVTRVRVATAA